MIGPISITILVAFYPTIIECGRIRREAEIIEIARDLVNSYHIKEYFDPIFGVRLAKAGDHINNDESRVTLDKEPEESADKITAWKGDTTIINNKARSHHITKHDYQENTVQEDTDQGQGNLRISNIKNIKEYILSNPRILKEIERNSSWHNSEPVIRCKKFCRDRSECCKIIYRIQRSELGLMSRALSSHYVPAISKGLTLAGTVGLALMGLSYFSSRDGKSSFLSETAQYDFDKNKRLFIEANDELWIKKLENYVANDSDLNEVDSFFCCLSTKPSGGMECFPQKRKKSKTRYRSQFNKIDITCKSGLSYNIAVNLNTNKS